VLAFKSHLPFCLIVVCCISAVVYHNGTGLLMTHASQ